MNPKLQELLSLIDDWAKRNKDDERALFDAWNVLLALRGPDDENHEDKVQVTWPIRKAALPKLTACVVEACPGPWYLDWLKAAKEPAISYSHNHFNAHAIHAASALGLAARSRE